MPAKTDESLAKRLLEGDKRALARAITLIENDDPAGWELVREVYPQTGKARIVGLTGPPGVGKSTLIGALTKEMREAERQVAVLSIDPSSPFTRGALLGDRIRLSDHFLDSGVFIRSMASRGALGGLSEATLQAALLMDASGKDDVFIETVGVGQAEIDIVDHGDTVVLVLMPGSGDSIQALKAGVMEIPDIIVVNKADHPMTDTMVREIRGVLSLGPAASWRVPILRTEAARGEGVAELAEKHQRAPRPHRGRGNAGGAAGAQPAQRGAGAGRGAGCGAGWMRRSPGPRDRRAAGAGRPARARPRQRRDRAAGAPGWLRAPSAETGQSSRVSRSCRAWTTPSTGSGCGWTASAAARSAASPASTSTPRTASRAGRCSALARSRGCTAIPFEHVAEGAGRLWAGYERDWVREAPRFKANEALTADNELRALRPLGHPRRLRPRGRDRPSRRRRDLGDPVRVRLSD